MLWRTDKKCNDCPFRNSGAGLRLRKSLAPGRWRSILKDLQNDHNFFYCHKTTEFDDEEESKVSKGLLCSGGIEWQDKHGYTAVFVRLNRMFDERRKQASK